MTERALRFVLLLAVVCPLLVSCSPKAVGTKTNGTQTTTSVTETDLKAAYQARNLGLAHLENDDQFEAFEPLKTVLETVPDDPFGPQNLAVAGVMAIAKLDAKRDAAKIADAAAAASAGLSALQKISPESATLAFLSGQLQHATGQGQAAYDQFLRAAHLAEQEEDRVHAAAFWYAAYETSVERQLGDDQQRLALLLSAHEDQPQNLFLLTETLRLAAATKSPEFPTLLATANKLVAPIRDGIIKQSGQRYDPQIFLDRAAEAVDGTELAAALPMLTAFSQILRAQPIVRSDLGLLKPNLLEFARLDFTPAFYAKHPLTIREDLIVPTLSADWPKSFAKAVYELGDDAALKSLVGGDIDLDGVYDSFAVTVNSTTARTTLVPCGVRPNDSPQCNPIEVPGIYEQAILVDLDNDFPANPSATVNQAAGNSPCRTTDLDLVLYGTDGLAIALNSEADGSRTFDVSESEDLKKLSAVASVAVFDGDGDGDLDLAVAMQSGGVEFLKNRGDGSFEQAPNPIASVDEIGEVVRLLPVDIDRDVDIDLIALRKADPPVVLCENLRHGNFRAKAVPHAFGPGEEAIDIALLDNDENRSWDLLVTTADAAKLMRSTTAAPGNWSVNEAVDLPIAGPITPGDFNNDGRIDLITSDGVLWSGLPAAPWFKPNDQADQSVPNNAFDLVVRDFDGDASLDVLCISDDGLHALRSTTENVGNSATVTLLAQQIKDGGASASGRVNAYGLGSTLEVRTGSRVISRVVDSQVTHIGIGSSPDPDTIRIAWTNGIPSQIIGPPVNSYVCEIQTLKGSCPYLYGWDGEKFAFITDLLWAAPVGLQFADGVQAVPREWEHLMIPGRLMQPRDGKYEIRVTEELWEAAYFDQIRLTAVDHPAGTELVTNEKVGPPSIAQPRLYVFDEAMPPTRGQAVYADETTLDITAQILATDGDYVQTFREKHLQGLVDLHDMEMEFADLPQSAQGQTITLMLTGWVRPSDTSINVGLTANPNYESPVPPQLLAPDYDGRWKTVRPFMGFPGGKTKTIAVDVTDAINHADPRLRIRTSMEFYWDRAALVVGEAQEPVRELECTLESADLHHRGLSHRVDDPDNGPESYDYNALDSGRDWPPMFGRFTRYGQVEQLLQAADDQLVVIGSGDEITITFSGLPPVQDGWVRDFVMSNVGWDKDADLNTLYGESSEPYPTLGIQQYPEFHDFETRSDAKFQTRRQISTP